MKIASSQITTQSHVVHREMKETKRNISYQNFALQAGVTTSGNKVGKTETENAFSEMRQKSLAYLLELLFGKDTKDRLMNNRSFTENQTAGQLGFQIQQMDYVEHLSVSQEASFTTDGKVITEDGREIDFHMNVYMSSSFESWYEEHSVSLPDAQLCDPLVINLDTDTARISDQTFYFDLDGDGNKEEIGQLGKGSGYLALDLNNDGEINDGSELFGTKSGNGFYDLSQYDDDKNGWIDENDAVWDKLKIWVHEKDGTPKLYSLAQKGVGAIFLHAAPTQVKQFEKDGSTKGQVQSTGMFLYENGRSGTIQHVDYAM